MSTNSEYRAERQRSSTRKKNKGDIFLLEEQHENFVAAVTKWEMLAAPMQGENERQWKKKWTRTCTTFPQKNV